MINTTGVKVIDDHRTNIVKTIDSMYSLIINKKYEQKALASVLKELLVESEIEFKLEEYFLKEIHYPKLEDQIKEHKEVIEKVKNFICEFEDGIKEIEKINEVFSFLNELYTKHMIEEDRKIKHYMEILKHIKQNKIDVFKIDIVNIIDDIYDKYSNNYFSKGE